MAITRNGTVTELSGTIALNDLFASAEFTNRSGSVIRLDRDLRVMDGTDISLMNGAMFDLNGFNMDVETAGSCPQFIGCMFLYNGVTAQNGESNQWGATSLNLKNCSIYFRNTRSTFGIEGADNVVFSGSFQDGLGGTLVTGADTSGAGAPFFTRGNTFTGVSFYNSYRIGVAGTGTNVAENRFHFKNMFIQAAGAFIIGYNTAPESIWENCTLTGQTSFSADTFLNNNRENNMVLLGNNTIEMFFDGGTTFTRTNASNQLRVYKGGKKYLNILDGQGLVFSFVATIDNTVARRPIVVTRDVDHLLSDTTITVASDDENIDMTLLTGIWDPGGTAALGGNGLVDYSDMYLIGRNYYKEIYLEEFATVQDAQEISGSSDAYPPLLIFADEKVTNTEADAGNLTGIAITKATGVPSPTNPHRIVVSDAARTLDDVYDYWKWWFCQTNQFDIKDELTATGNKLTLGNYRLEFA